LLPVGKHVEFDPYYEHENNTGKRPNQQVNAIGLILNLFFSASEPNAGNHSDHVPGARPGSGAKRHSQGQRASLRDTFPGASCV